MKKSKLFVYPSHQESWGIVIAEAIACGLPVVAYDLPVYKEIFDGHIYTIGLEDTRKMADKIIDIFDDYERYKKVAETAKGFISKYDWANIQRHELHHVGEVAND